MHEAPKALPCCSQTSTDVWGGYTGRQRMVHQKQTRQVEGEFDMEISVDYAMICQHGGLTFIRHSKPRDLTAEWLQEVCHDVTVEPPLLPELITPSSTNCSNTARADIHARGFWGRRQGALFDVRVFHPNVPSYRQTRVASVFR